jgi:hypothetical protein
MIYKLINGKVVFILIAIESVGFCFSYIITNNSSNDKYLNSIQSDSNSNHGLFERFIKLFVCSALLLISQNLSYN